VYREPDYFAAPSTKNERRRREEGTSGEEGQGGSEGNDSHAYAALAILSIYLVNSGQCRWSIFFRCFYLGSLLYRHEAGSALVPPD